MKEEIMLEKFIRGLKDKDIVVEENVDLNTKKIWNPSELIKVIESIHKDSKVLKAIKECKPFEKEAAIGSMEVKDIAVFYEKNRKKC